MIRRFSQTGGFSSLEVKCLLIFGAFLIGVMTISFTLYWYVTESVVAQRDPDTARLLADRALLIKHWGKLESKKEFLWIVNQLTDQLSDQKYEWEMISPDLALPLPAAAFDSNRPDSIQSSSNHEHLNPLPSPNSPQRSVSVADSSPSADFSSPEHNEFIREMLEKSRESSEQQLSPKGVMIGENYLYYRPVYAEQTCLDLCHSDLDTVKRLNRDEYAPSPKILQVGDLMTILCVKIPNGPTQSTMNWFWNMLLTVVVITVFLGIFAFYVTIRYVIIRPLRHIREVTTAVFHGNMEVRAELHTGDEFESLAQAFNRMLRGLINSQRDLRRANQSLDKKIDELGRANLHLKEMNRVKSDFLATMSHELRTPLNSILGFSEVLAEIKSLDDRQKRYVQNIQKSGRMLLAMINDVLDLAKMESDRAEIHPTDFSLEYVISAQCDMARPLAEKKTISLAYEIPKGIPMVHLDQNRLQQIVNNLLSNAIKFTPEGGVVKVLVTPENLDENGSIDPETSSFLMAVSDTGVGMTEEDLKTIFEKFRQGSSAIGQNMMTREHSGTGLGLSIVKEICHLLHGEITVSSTPGIGSTFNVRLPWKIQPVKEKEEDILF
ncbi:MAG: HAMP domain-containing protein [Planctomycetaceae bacterium]|nr:HAMP domain-containing protein [Planctomycetaceae bacterium]